ncbi:MAG: ATP-binding protein [Elusimicrobiota bacterium]
MRERIQILLIEDEPDYVVLMSAHLNEACGSSLHFVLECAESLQEGMDLLAQKDFDVLLLDLMLPDSQGIETLVKARAQAREIPIVVLTNLDDEETGLDAIAHGAQDFLGKGKLDARLFKRAVGYALERSRHLSQIESILGNSPYGMVVVDTDGIVRYLNPAAEALFGKGTKEMLGKPFGFPVQPKKTAELRLPGEDGGERILEMRVTEIQWRKDKVCLASIQDLTELRRFEQIRAEIKERRRIDQLKEAFLSTVSHELRSPLTVIKAIVANLRDRLAGPLPEPYDEMIRLADANVCRLGRVINNLLDLSRLESGRARISPAPVDLGKVIEETAQEFRMTAPGKKMNLETDVPPDLPPVCADPDMVAQILCNLMDNALRYARGRVVLRARTVDTDQVQVSVIDDGPGISEDKIGELFNRFVQVDRPTGGSGYKGTGLGLAICKESVRMNKGRIWVESVAGQGAQFHFALPRYGGFEATHACLAEDKGTAH